MGITGIPGSGKTAFAHLLVERGADLVDVDEAGKWAINENKNVRHRIKAVFGKEYFEQDVLLRKKLGTLVFSEETARKQLNSIVHPVMLRRVDKLISEFQKPSENSFIIVDAALLFELNIDRKCDVSITVWADEEKCIQRSIERDKITRAQAVQRIQSQLPQDEKKQRADILVENNASIQDLEEHAEKMFQQLLIIQKQKSQA